MRDFNFGVIISTNSYSGNFEREMCAFVTGQTGECGVGSKEAEMFNAWAEANNTDSGMFDSFVTHISDEGCYRPVTIWQNDKGIYNDVMIFFERKPTVEMLDIINGRVADFASSSGIEIIGIRLIARNIQVIDTVVD